MWPLRLRKMPFDASVAPPKARKKWRFDDPVDVTDAPQTVNGRSQKPVVLQGIPEYV